jgi:hypothetical protein
MKNSGACLIVRGTLGVAFMAAAGIVPATADSLPAATYNSTLSGQFARIHQQTSPGTISNGDGSVTLGGSPSTYIEIDCNMPTGSSDNQCSGGENYSFEFFGAAGTTVLVDTSYSMSFSEDPNLGSADIRLTLLDYFSQNGIDSACLGGNESGCYVDHTQGSLTGTLKDTLNANQVYELQLSASGTAESTISGLNTHVFLDPVISIDAADPSFGTNSYSLLLSNGVGNSQFSATSPEPASVGLIVAGLAGIAVWRRRRL